MEIPYFVEAHVTFDFHHYSTQRLLNIGGNGLRFLSKQKLKVGEKRKVFVHFPFIFDRLPLEIVVLRASAKRLPAVVGKKPENFWAISCRFTNLTIASDSAIFQYVRFLERRQIAYKRNGLHRVDIPDDLSLYIAYGNEWYRIKHKVKNLSENGLLYETGALLEPGTKKSAYLGFPWTTELQKLSLGVVRISEKEKQFRHSVRPYYEVGCRLENLYQKTQEKLYDHMSHMQKYGVTPKKRIAPVR